METTEYLERTREVGLAQLVVGERAPAPALLLEDGTALQQFVQQGEIIDLSGKSPTCAWNQAAATCGWVA